MWLDDPNWLMTVLWLLALALLFLAMKVAAAFVAPSQPAGRNVSPLFFILPSPKSRDRLKPITNATRPGLRFIMFLVALAAGYLLFWQVASLAPLPGWILGYCAVPLLLLMSELLHSVMTLLLLPTGQLLSPLHNRPWLAGTVSDFWAHRWNLWFSDWFRQVLFQSMRRRPAAGLIVVFAVSGVMHEWANNVPLYLLTGRNLFGSQMLYFLLQAGGILLERRYLRRHTRLKCVFTWLVVLVPAPLVLNEGLLRTLHLWPS